MNRPQSSTAARISVIVPAYNSAQTLQSCLEALLAALCYIDRGEIIVVDDGSTDDTQLIASRYSVRVLQLVQNTGPAAARNHGASCAQGDILMFVDADVMVAEDALVRVVRQFTRNTDCVAVIGSYDIEPGAGNLISTYRNLLHHYVHQKTSTSASHFWTGLGAIRRTVFESLGGFDERKFGRALEDIELGYRLRMRGYPITLDKAIQGKHLKHWTLLSMIRTDLLVRAIPWTHLLFQYRNIPDDFSLGRSQRISVALAWTSALATLAIFIRPGSALVALLALFGFVVVNLDFFAFMAKKQGVLFSIACVPLHLLFHFNAGLGFIVGTITFFLPRLTGTLNSTLNRDI